MDIDLTAEGLNTLSDQAMDVAKSVDEETTIYLIGSEEAYRDNQLYTDYGIEYSQVANLAERLQEANPLISVRFMDPDTNPDFISEHADDYLVSGKVMVETEKRSRVLTVNDLFSLQQDQTTGMTVGYSMVDSALAGALEMVNLDEVPVLTIATGHDEILNSENLAGFTSLMEDQNFEVQEIDIMVDEIPEETQILMLPTPNTDYTDEEIQKLRDFVNDEEREEALTLLVTTLPNQAELPKLAGFLEEWGVAVEPGVVAETDSSRVAVANGSYVLVDASEDMLEDGNYTRLVAPSSSPLTLLFSGNDGHLHPGPVDHRGHRLCGDRGHHPGGGRRPGDSQQVVASHSYKYVTVGDSSVTPERAGCSVPAMCSWTPSSPPPPLTTRPISPTCSTPWPAPTAAPSP